MGRTEDVLKMIRQYPSLFEKGMSNREISEYCGVSYRTVIYHLGEISENMGVSRESLLGGCPSQKSNKTLKMISNYPFLYEKGMTNKEIAKHCGVSYKTVINCLGKISENMGVPRESLLSDRRAAKAPMEKKPQAPRENSDGVAKLFDRYADLHNAGVSNPDIAKQCGISISTLYKYLPDIAKQMGVPRDSLVEDCGRKPERKSKATYAIAEEKEKVVKPVVGSRTSDEIGLALKEALDKLYEMLEASDYRKLLNAGSERTTIDVFVEDGKIFINGDEVSNSFDEFSLLTSVIIKRRECADLRVKDVPLLAMLLRITGASKDYNLFVDDTVFGKAFTALRGIY